VISLYGTNKEWLNLDILPKSAMNFADTGTSSFLLQLEKYHWDTTMSFTYHPDFTEAMRDAFCNGDKCPQCLGSNVKCVGAAPDGIRMNHFFDCEECGAQWEGD
jgi:hypothetical protein